MDRLEQSRYELGVERVEADVCVVGAGPAGLVVAQRLLEAGVSCRVLERQSSAELCSRAKAGMLEHRSVLSLEQHGLAKPIRERGGSNGVVEIRVGGAVHVFDYAALTGGRGHFVFPQHLLVRAWADAFVQQGGALAYEAEVSKIEQAPAAPQGGRSVVHARLGSGALQVHCTAVVLSAGAGCSLIPEGIVSHEHS